MVGLQQAVISLSCCSCRPFHVEFYKQVSTWLCSHAFAKCYSKCVCNSALTYVYHMIWVWIVQTNNSVFFFLFRFLLLQFHRFWWEAFSWWKQAVQVNEASLQCQWPREETDCCQSIERFYAYSGGSKGKCAFLFLLNLFFDLYYFWCALTLLSIMNEKESGKKCLLDAYSLTQGLKDSQWLIYKSINISGTCSAEMKQVLSLLVHFVVSPLTVTQ